MILIRIIYWFNPIVLVALKEMCHDREIACDSSVLKMLEYKDYINYGNTLINFAEKISTTPFPFVAGLGGNMKQIKRRILNIASYENPTYWKRIRIDCFFNDSYFTFWLLSYVVHICIGGMLYLGYFLKKDYACRSLIIF